MNTPRYSTKNIEFYTELRKSVRDYFKNNKIQQYGNSEILVKTVFMSVLYVAPFALMLSGIITSVPLVILCWAIMGCGMAGLGMVTMHDANHGSFSKHRWVNKLFSKSMYLLGGYPANWKFQHNTLHHTYTNIEGHDEDIAHEGVLRFSPHKPLKKVHKFQHVYAWFLYGLMTISWISARDFKKFKEYKALDAGNGSEKKYAGKLAELVISKMIYFSVFLLLPILLVPVSWVWLLLGFLIMHFVGGVILSAIFQTAHVVPSADYPMPNKNNEIENNWAIHQLYTTCNFAPKSNIFSWFIGGLNYQVEHHLFPHVSHVHYKQLAKIVRQTAEKHGLPYYVNNTFLDAVKQHIVMLKILGRPAMNKIR